MHLQVMVAGLASLEVADPLVDAVKLRVQLFRDLEPYRLKQLGVVAVEGNCEGASE